MVDREQIATDWAVRGFSCDLWTDSPGQRWDDFTHAKDEVVVVLEGDMEFEVEGAVHHRKSGEELQFLAGAVHSAQNIGSTTARWLYGYRNNQQGSDATDVLASDRTTAENADFPGDSRHYRPQPSFLFTTVLPPGRL